MSNAEIDALPDRIAATFTGLKVLITGGTGFLGKVLVEKLLRKCPDIKQILLLVRSKKGKNPKQRLEDIFNGALFEKLREMKGGVEPLLEKVTIVEGDVSEPDLGMSEEDKQMIINEVDIIVHAAATVRFDEMLKSAVMLNVRGTKLMVELAKKCKKFKLFMHISTAYCQPLEKVLEEKAYPPFADPHQVIQTLEWMNDEAIAALTPKLLDKLPNPYAFTKALAEALVVEAMDHIPAVVLRPSIVIPIWQEPVPGWTDNINGPTGMLIGAGKGVIRTMYCKGDSYGDFLPVDVCINAIMMIAWNFISNGDTKTDIINLTTSAEIKMTWSEIIDTGKGITTSKVPFNGIAWYPGGSMKHSRIHHNICAFFFHWIPAFIVDTLLFCLGYKPVLVRVQRRIAKGFEVLEYYATNQWEFKSDNIQTLRQLLNAREKQDYILDGTDLDIPKYFEDCIRAARLFILKESDDTLPAARRHMNVMWCVDLIVKSLFWGLLLYWLSGWILSPFIRESSESPSLIRESSESPSLLIMDA